MKRSSQTARIISHPNGVAVAIFDDTEEEIAFDDRGGLRLADIKSALDDLGVEAQTSDGVPMEHEVSGRLWLGDIDDDGIDSLESILSHFGFSSVENEEIEADFDVLEDEEDIGEDDEDDE